MYYINPFAYQVILYSLSLTNFVFAPYLIKKARLRIKEVMNNQVNDSYSMISIWILKIVIV